MASLSDSASLGNCCQSEGARTEWKESPPNRRAEQDSDDRTRRGHTSTPSQGKSRTM